MAALPLPPLAIDADPVTGLPEYSAAAFRAAWSAMLANGGTVGVARTGALDQRALVTSMPGPNVVVSSGGYAVGTPAGVYLAALTSPLTVGGLAPADATNARADRVVLRIDDPSNGGGSARSASIEIITGVPSAAPSLAPVPGTSVYADLARIDVPRNGGGSPSVTDLRTFTASAGGVVPVRNATQLSGYAPPSGTLAFNLAESSLSVRAGSAWRTVRVANESSVALPAPSNGFAVKEALFADVVDGTVYLRGMVANSTLTGGWTTVLMLPAGVRPKGSIATRASGNTETNISIQVQPSGAVQVWYGATSASWLSLASIPPYRAA